jgi:hypothetical protein
MDMSANVALLSRFQNEQGSTEDWGRLPKPKDRLWGLSRTTLLELSNAGLIRTVVIKKPGAIKGIRLIYMPSLRAYLERLALEQNHHEASE